MINPEYYFEMNELANECRREWFIDENMPIDIFSIVKNKINNLTIVFMQMSESISGASSQYEDEKIIFINSKESYGRQRFDLAHELYHLRYDQSIKTCVKYSEDEIEKKADQFASCLLLPHGALRYYEQVNNINKWTIDEIIDAEQFFQISHHSLLWRLRNLEKITYSEFQSFKKNPASYSRKKGYNTKLYESYTDNKNSTEGHYINLVNKLFEDELISNGKRDEILLDAFCDDKVWI